MRRAQHTRMDAAILGFWGVLQRTTWRLGYACLKIRKHKLQYVGLIFAVVAVVVCLKKTVFTFSWCGVLFIHLIYFFLFFFVFVQLILEWLVRLYLITTIILMTLIINQIKHFNKKGCLNKVSKQNSDIQCSSTHKNRINIHLFFI